MKSFIVMMSLFAASAAFAGETTVCESPAGDLVVRLAGVYSDNGAVLVLSNPRINHGNRTIARFTEANNTLRMVRNGAIARVDRRYNDSNRGGELLAGTRLSEVKEIHLMLSDSAEADATLVLFKRNGKIRHVALDCIN